MPELAQNIFWRGEKEAILHSVGKSTVSSALLSGNRLFVQVAMGLTDLLPEPGEDPEVLGSPWEELEQESQAIRRALDTRQRTLEGPCWAAYLELSFEKLRLFR